MRFIAYLLRYFHGNSFLIKSSKLFFGRFADDYPFGNQYRTFSFINTVLLELYGGGNTNPIARVQVHDFGQYASKTAILNIVRTARHHVPTDHDILRRKPLIRGDESFKFNRLSNIRL